MYWCVLMSGTKPSFEVVSLLELLELLLVGKEVGRAVMLFALHSAVLPA
ncbi:MAG TPA: hypothetical protein PLM74_07985 [Bacillota bacterium]|jgi:hypothetical protein|nr:hypothetical protein [Bacillota bacterium]